MLDDKRQFTRFDIPLIVEFKPTKGASKFSWGLTRNFSYEGFSFESLNSDFAPKENLEFKLKFPRSGTFVSVLGNVIWKRQVEDKCLAGVKLGEMDEKIKSEILEKICAYGNVSTDKIFYRKRPVNVTIDEAEEKSAKKLGSREKSVTNFLKTFLKKSKHIGIEKQYLKSKPVCKVTFRLPKKAAPGAQSVTIVGEFNNWDMTETPMKKFKNGDFALTLELPCNREYRFRYLIDGNRWENDWNADKYILNPYGCDDSVVVV